MDKIFEEVLYEDISILPFWDSSGVCLSYWDRNCMLKYANDAYLKYFGYPEQVKEKLNLIHHWGKENYNNQVKVIESVWKGNPQEISLELIDGFGKHKLTNLGILPHFEDNLVQGFLLYLTDVENVNFSHSVNCNIHLQKIFEKVSDYIILCNEKGRFMYVNSRFEHFVGLPLPEIQNLYLNDIIFDEEIFALSDGKTNERQNGGGFNGRKWLLTKSQGRVPVDVFISPFKFTNDQFVFCVLVKDLSITYSQEEELLELKTIVNNCNDVILSKDLNGKVKTWNKAAENLFGYTLSEIKGKQISILIPPELLEEERLLMQKMKNGESVSQIQTTRVSKVGQRIPVSMSLSPIKDPFGKVIGVSKIIRDITSLKKYEEGLIFDNKLNRLFVEQAPYSIAMFDLNMKYVALSKKWASDYKLGSKQIIGMSHYDIFPEISDEWKEIFNEGLLGKEFDKEGEPFFRANGAVQWIKWSVRPWYLDADQIGGIFLLTEDISESKRLESEKQELLTKLKRSNEDIKAILDSSLVSIIATSREGLITHFNRGAEQMLQYKAEEMVGIHSPMKIHLLSEVKEYEAELNQRFKVNLNGFDVFIENLKRGNHEVKEWTYIRKDGTFVPVQLCVTPITDSNGEIKGFLGVATDISSIKKMYDELKMILSMSQNQNERLKNFAHIVSHNLRAHSSNIDMMLGILKEEHPQLDNEELFSHLLKSSVSLNETINNLTEVVKINTMLKTSLVRIDLKKAIERAKLDVFQMIKKADVTIEVDESANIEILGIPAYVDSILNNLLTNGIKYRDPRKKAFVKFYCEVIDKKNCLVVEDNGLGIDLKKVGDKIFGMYRTFHGNKDARGIGLFITKNQIEAMDGTIELESTPGVGTKFNIIFSI